MSDEKKRIIEQTASTSIANDDWFVKDGATGGTTKIQGGKLKELMTADVDADIVNLYKCIIADSDTWSDVTTYHKNDVVKYNGTLQRCAVDTATVGEFKPLEWSNYNLVDAIEAIKRYWFIAEEFAVASQSGLFTRYRGEIVYKVVNYSNQYYMCLREMDGATEWDDDDWLSLGGLEPVISNISKTLTEGIDELSDETIHINSNGGFYVYVNEE